MSPKSKIISFLLELFNLKGLYNADLSSVEARAKERYRNITLSGLSSIISSGSSFFVSLITVPLIFNYLGSERYGLWVALNAAVNLFAFIDFGIGNSLINTVADAYGKSDKKIAQRYISSVFYSTTLIVFVLGLLYLALFENINWIRIFKVSSPQAVSEAGKAFSLIFIIFLFNLLLSVVQKVQSGLQVGYISNIWRSLGNLASLIAVYLAITYNGNLYGIILSVLGMPVITTAINFWIYFRKHSWLIPKITEIKWESSRIIFKLGWMYFILQLAWAIGFQTDVIVLTQIIGPTAVANYHIPSKLLSYVPMLAGFFLMPLWPAYSDAASRRDDQWIQFTFRRSLYSSVLFGLLLLVPLVVFGPQITKVWIGTQIQSSSQLYSSLGIWNLIYIFSIAYAMYFNGMGIIKIQVIGSSFMAVTNIILSIILVHKIGVIGVVWGSIISLTACNLIPMTIYLIRKNRVNKSTQYM